MELFVGGFVVFWFLMMAVAVGGTVLWVVALIEMVKYPDPVWKIAGQEKMTWLIIVIVIGIIGAAVYWFGPRPKLKEAEVRFGREGWAAVPAPPPPAGYGAQPWGYPAQPGHPPQGQPLPGQPPPPPPRGWAPPPPPARPSAGEPPIEPPA